MLVVNERRSSASIIPARMDAHLPDPYFEVMPQDPHFQGPTGAGDTAVRAAGLQLPSSASQTPHSPNRR